MLFGLDRLPRLSSLVSELRSRRFALLAHAASVDSQLRHVGEVLDLLELRPQCIFGPEHGYGSEAQDMVGLDHAHDRRGVPVISLYGHRFETWPLAPNTCAISTCC